MHTALVALLCLLSGPAFAVLILAVGCALPWQLLGVMCGHNGYLSLLIFTLAGWALLVVGWAFLHVRRSFK
jgi:hypothetical protein